MKYLEVITKLYLENGEEESEELKEFMTSVQSGKLQREFMNKDTNNRIKFTKVTMTATIKN